MLTAIRNAVTQQFMPFLVWIGELRDKKTLRADFIAGITVGLVLVPQSMAYAQLASLPPYYGLYAAFMPPMVAALFGSSRQLATGPVAVVSLMTAAALEPIAASGSPGFIAYAIMLAFMVGMFQLALGLLRLGVLVNFLSHPVVLGFTNAAAIIIATSQLDKIFGVQVEKAPQHYETVWNTLAASTSFTHWPTLLFAILAFAIMIILRRISPKIPNVLIAVVITTTISWMIGFQKLHNTQLKHFDDEVVRNSINEYFASEKQLALFKSKIADAEKKRDEVIAKFGHGHAQTVTAIRNLTTLKSKLDLKFNTVKSDLRELKKIHFAFTPGAEEKEVKYYLYDNVPKHMESDGRIWRVKQIEKNETILMTSGGNVVGQIPSGLPSFQLPSFDFTLMLQLLSSAIAISLIGFMEAISIAKAMAAKTRQRLDANQELVGQGLGNIIGSMFQSYPTSGSFSRSAVNISTGAITGFSSVVTSLLVLTVLLWLTPLLYYLPQATLAAVIMMAVLGLVNIKAIKHSWQTHKHDGIVAIITFVLTLAFAPHLDKGILIGAGLALILYLFRTMKPRVAVLARHPDGTLRDAELYGLETCNDISMVRFDGSLYFANTSYFEDKVLERVADKPELKYVIIVGDGINAIDATGEEMISELTQRLEKAGVELLFTGLKKQVLDIFSRTGLYDKLGSDHFYRTEEQALDSVWQKLGNNHEADCPLNIVCPITPMK